MFQKFLPLKFSLNWLFFLFVYVIVFVFSPSSFCQNDSLNVQFESVSIQDTTVFRNLTAGFPYPILSLITIKDQHGLYIHGLADTARWLTAADTTQSGLLVDDVWKTILEYHKEDTTLPANPDVKQTRPGFMVTEITTIGLSVAFVMDYSGSMSDDDLRIAEEAAKGFVRHMRSYDCAAIVKFAGIVEIFQKFTSDTTLLNAAIDRQLSNRASTSLYDAIYTGITLSLDQSGRRAVIVYTDGQDTKSVHSIDAVINYAKENSVPVFVIGLGKDVASEFLTRIADETGGIYFSASSAEELASIYLYIYGLIKGYYVLAHTSPDPIPDGTWRTVDLTIDYNGTIGRGLGTYCAPYVPPDVRVSKHVLTDSLSVDDGDTLYFAKPGDTVSYKIYVTNDGPTPASDIRVVDIFPDSLFPVDFEISPDSVTDDSIIWKVPSLNVGETVRIGCRFFLDTLGYRERVFIVNKVSAKCVPDTFLTNNTDSAAFYFIPLIPPDISITKQAIGDSLVVSHGDSTWYVFSGDTIIYRVLLSNYGEIDARTITVRDILPEEVKLIKFSGPSFSQNGDTLSWVVNKLDARDGKMGFKYSCRVDIPVPPWDIPLVNQVTTLCKQDTIPGNNFAQDTVWVVGIYPSNPQIRVSPPVVTPGDTVSVEVITPVSVKSWDIKIFFEDGSLISTYGDEFIQSTTLAPRVWTRIVPPFEDTWMRTNEKQEKVGVVFQTVDLWDIAQSDTAYFLVRSSDEFLLDKNVFRVNSDGFLGMRFKLSSNRPAKIVVYDIAGGFVKEVVNGQFRAGWNFTTWNGKDKSDRLVGSGIYVAILTSGNFKKARKFILVR